MRKPGVTVALEQTERFLCALEGAVDANGIASLVSTTMSRFGVTSTLTGVVSASTAGPPQVLFQNYPDEWVQRYIAQDYLSSDPVVLRAKASPTSFGWGEATRFMRSNRQARQIMGDARAFQLDDGYSTSLVNLDGAHIVCSVAGSQLDGDDPQLQQMLPMVAGAAVTHALRLRRQSTAVAGVHLSPREAEALRWVSEGKSDWEIGVLMRISEHGVDKHLRSVFVKLKAVSRAHAVAEALRRGVLR